MIRHLIAVGAICLCATRVHAGIIKGSVQLADDTPAPNALVMVHGEEHFAAVRTDSNGRFTIVVPSSAKSTPFTLRVQLSGYQTSITKVGSDSSPTIRLTPLSSGRGCGNQCTVTGVVRDSLGQPVRGATVMAKTFMRDRPTLRTQSAADGSFSFTGFEDYLLHVTAIHPDYVAEAPVPVQPRMTRNAVVSMRTKEQANRNPNQSFDGVVAIGTLPSHQEASVPDTYVTLAMPAGPSGWRSRVLETPWFDAIAMTASGTKLVLSRRRDPVHVLPVDITTPISKVFLGQAPVTSQPVQIDVGTTSDTVLHVQLPPAGLAATSLNPHDLDEWVTLKSSRGLEVVKDFAMRVPDNDVGPCRAMSGRVTDVAVSSAQSVLCVDSDGGMGVVPLQLPLQRVAGRLDPGTVIVADGGDPRLPSIAEFIAVAFTPTTIELSSVLDGRFLARLQLDAARVSHREPYGVLAALALQSRVAPRVVGLFSIDTAIGVLPGAAEAPAGSEWQWTFRRTYLDERIYAPVMEFERSELAFPGKTNVWNTKLLLAGLPTTVVAQRIPGSMQVARQRYFLRQYDSTRRQDPSPLGTVTFAGAGDAKCAIYFKTLDLGRTWLVQYWFYYPFDIGGFGSHLHDSEHLFVEVDKLGGQVLNIIGAAHGGLTANNVFRSASSSNPVSLPLFAIAELGKHATAPDLNHDGRFTPGLDDNIHHATAQLWGIRDTMGNTDSRLAAFGGHMAADHAELLAAASTKDIFNVAAKKLRFEDRCQCDLLPFPEISSRLTKGDCRDGSWLNHEATAPGADCATEFLNSERDRVDINNIWKKWNFPAAFVRAGTHTRSADAVGPALDLDAVFSLEAPTRDILHGRIVLGGSVHPGGQEWRVQYEGFVTNILGVFGGWQHDRVGSTPSRSRWTIGPLMEFPIPIIKRPGMAALAIGVRSGSGLSVQWRFAIDVWAHQRYGFAGTVQPERELR